MQGVCDLAQCDRAGCLRQLIDQLRELAEGRDERRQVDGPEDVEVDAESLQEPPPLTGRIHRQVERLQQMRDFRENNLVDRGHQPPPGTCGGVPNCSGTS